MFWFVIIVEFVVIIGLFFSLGSILFSTWTEAPFVPTGRRALRNILAAAKIKPGEVFYDLGSGDGRLVIAAAKQGAKAYGVERVLTLVLWSRLNIWLFGLRGKAFIKYGNLLKTDIREADIVFCYLMPHGMEKLQRKLEVELRPGTRLLARAFKVPNWEPLAIHKFSKYQPFVYEYLIQNSKIKS